MEIMKGLTLGADGKAPFTVGEEELKTAAGASMKVGGITISENTSIMPPKYTVDDLMFKDHNHMERSLRDVYRRFELIESREMMRTPPGTYTPPHLTPVSKEEYELRISRLEQENRTLSENLEKVAKFLADKIKVIEADLADRPQTTPTW
jgi:hypothetical protein